jgi:glutaminyl-peptide cyclotransferase
MISRPRLRTLGCALAGLSCWLVSTLTPGLVAQGSTPVDTYRVIKAYPHDPNAYTQGLIYRDGFLYESTGLVGRSSLRKVKLETGEIVQQRRIDQPHFAEGLADWRGQLVQLTWQSNLAFVYELETLAPRRTFSYSGEGWGLTHDGKRFILSDGTSQLRFLDPETFREIGRVTVTDGKSPIGNLNELEYIRGEVYANVWHTDRIARISPESGRVIRWLDLGGVMSGGYKLDSEAVLNGIAHDAAGNRLFVTGKMWPRLFEVEIIPRVRE